MGENNRPAGWKQNKNMPDSWGKGGSASPWGNKENIQPVNATKNKQPAKPEAQTEAVNTETKEAVHVQNETFPFEKDKCAPTHLNDFKEIEEQIYAIWKIDMFIRRIAVHVPSEES